MRQYQPQHAGFLDLIWNYKFHLAFYVVGISFLSFATLYTFNIVPEELKFIDQTPEVSVPTTATGTAIIPKVTGAATTTATLQGELPQRIIISKVGIDTLITNPSSANANVLNDYLLKGAVRYPGSGTLGKGNVFIFGHSSGLKIINNQAFKAFNNLKGVNIDDTIKVQSATKEYTYRVVSVALVDSDKELVDLATSKNMITISTCNVFGEKQQRYVVQALFVGSKAL